MTFLALLILALWMSACNSCAHANRAADSATKPTNVAVKSVDAIPVIKADSSREDFATGVLPILKKNWQPCHFAGGKMYAKLPFDDPKTVTKLGVRLFSRIKDEKEQTLIRNFLAITPDSTNGGVAQQP